MEDPVPECAQRNPSGKWEKNDISGSAWVHQGHNFHFNDTAKEDTECLQDLHITNPSHDKKRIEATKGGLLEDAYHWVLENSDFQQWRDGHDCRLLWIKGDPGKGKTMMVCGIVNELKKSMAKTNLLSYFFCQATEEKINNATAVLRGLLYLLVSHQPSLIKCIREKYDRAGKALFEGANAWFALSEIFTNILQDPSLNSTYLIIDALDECVTGLEQLLKLVQNTSSSHVKWIVSSRNKHDIERQLKLNDSQRELSLELMANTKHISHAVSAYINDKILQLECLEDDDTLRNQVRRVLSKKANGTFLWVSIVVNELKTVDSWDMRKVLDEVPPGLDDLYARMMKQIEQLRNREYCQLVLSAATLTYRPLYIPELGMVSGLPDNIASKDKSVRTIVSKCGSFLTLRDGQVFIIHQSAKDYLEKNYISKLLPIGVTQGHVDISKRSIKAMSKLLEQNMYKLDFGFKPKDMSPPDPDPLAPIRYSCIYWADHLLLNSDSPECKAGLTDDGAVFGFLKEHFLCWLESLSLLGSFSGGVLSIRKLLQIVQNSRASPRFVEFLGDAEKFVRSHGSIIDRAPLQLYGSALVFSPRISYVKMAQWEKRLSFIKTVKGIKDRWDTHLQTLEGHSGFVKAVAFSPDSKTLASGSNDWTIRLWDTATGIHQQTLEGHSGSVNAVAFSPDSKTLASASGNYTIQLWEIATSACQQTLTLKEHQPIINLMFSEDGQYLKTNCGSLKLSESSSSDKHPDQRLTHNALSVNDEWVMLDGKNYLWLPKNYRATCEAIYHNTVLLGHASGGLTYLEFTFP